jgi:hypothetical protein
MSMIQTEIRPRDMKPGDLILVPHPHWEYLPLRKVELHGRGGGAFYYYWVKGVRQRHYIRACGRVWVRRQR